MLYQSPIYQVIFDKSGLTSTLKLIKCPMYKSQWEICQQVSLCVQDADLVVTATFSPDPYLKKEMISNGAHVMAVGAARPYLSELYPDLLNSSEVLMRIMNIT